MPYVFGVDGGASKSRSILITDQGRVVYVGKGPGVNYHEVGTSRVSSTIQRHFKDALEAARANPSECIGVCLGLAGVGRESDQRMLVPLFDDLFGKDHYLLTNDADIALTGGTLSEDGIIVLAGTGSMVYGRNREQVNARVGGYGPMISDEGSGYKMAISGLKAIAHSHDGFHGPTRIKDFFFNALNVSDFDEMIQLVNSSSLNREKIAALAPLVIRAASEDDPIADEIINHEADQLAIAVEVLHKKLQLPDRIDVVLSGGLFAEDSYYGQMVKRKIKYLLPGANVISPRLEPVIGAGLYALLMADVEVDDDLLDVIVRSYYEAPQPSIEEDLSEKKKEEKSVNSHHLE